MVPCVCFLVVMVRVLRVLDMASEDRVGVGWLSSHKQMGALLGTYIF